LLVNTVEDVEASKDIEKAAPSTKDVSLVTVSLLKRILCGKDLGSYVSRGPTLHMKRLVLWRLNS
jgi:hypothetical protein